MTSRFAPYSTSHEKERAVLVGVDLGPDKSEWPVETSLNELERLVETDGAMVVGRLTQRLDRPVARTFIGSGKTEELVCLAHNLEANVVVFDDELTPSQQANLERAIGNGIKVIDRTALILDIFGVHAKTREGRLQVQLAQLQYLYPRLRGMWSHLVREQTRGGIGSRFGQGESQLEVDRRLVRKRIATLQEKLSQLEKRRATQSKARWESGVWRTALAGYTNAGKSTLLNTLASANAYVQDELFATLDPTTRVLDLEEGRKIALTDTVGFIQKLPTTLVEAFKSTLAEVNAADLILRVVDASDEGYLRELAAVDEVLHQIGAADKRSVVVFNKIDLLSANELQHMRSAYPQAVFVSALTGEGLASLKYRIAKEASDGDVVLSVMIPYSKGLLMKMAHERCRVVHERYVEGRLLVTLNADKRMAATLEPYRVDESSL